MKSDIFAARLLKQKKSFVFAESLALVHCFVVERPSRQRELESEILLKYFIVDLGKKVRDEIN